MTMRFRMRASENPAIMRYRGLDILEVHHEYGTNYRRLARPRACDGGGISEAGLACDRHGAGRDAGQAEQSVGGAWQEPRNRAARHQQAGSARRAARET